MHSTLFTIPTRMPLDVEQLEALVDDLVLERQRLRETGAAAADLERNRRAIVAAHQRLARALIARYRTAA
jgi:hypothetical protein